MVSANYIRVLTYRQCEDCKCVYYDHAFEKMTFHKMEGGVTAAIKIECPNCESADISGCYYDQELTNPVLPLKYDFYEAPE